MTSTLCTPADMFANLPGILGFYPEKSIVLAGFHRSESTQQPGKYVLGPLFRTDSNRTDAIADILRNLTMSTDLIFGFIIDNGIYSDSNSAPCAQDYVRSLCAIARDHDAPLAAVWATPSLYTGEPYRRVFGLTQHDVGPATTGMPDVSHQWPVLHQRGIFLARACCPTLLEPIC